MLTLKGILLGTAIFVMVFVLYVIVSVWRFQSYFHSTFPAEHREVGVDLVTLYHNMGFPLWLLLSYAACLIIGCTIVALCHSKGVPVP